MKPLPATMVISSKDLFIEEILFFQYVLYVQAFLLALSHAYYSQISIGSSKICPLHSFDDDMHLRLLSW